MWGLNNIGGLAFSRLYGTCSWLAPRRRIKHFLQSDSHCCFIRPSSFSASNLVTATSTVRNGKYFTKYGCTNLPYRFFDIFSLQTGVHVTNLSIRTFYFQLFRQTTCDFWNLPLTSHCLHSQSWRFISFLIDQKFWRNSAEHVGKYGNWIWWVMWGFSDQSGRRMAFSSECQHLTTERCNLKICG